MSRGETRRGKRNLGKLIHGEMTSEKKKDVPSLGLEELVQQNRHANTLYLQSSQ